jgi:surface antigen
MNSTRLLTVFLALGISGTSAAARAEPTYEPAIQYALEYLTSGIATSSVVNGTEVAVMPMRTWKSVSGNYCRQYELTITKPSAAPDRAELTRCRDSDGKWKKVMED